MDTKSHIQTIEDLVRRLHLLLEREQTDIETIRDSREDSGSIDFGIPLDRSGEAPYYRSIDDALPWDSDEGFELESAYQGSFLGLMMPIPSHNGRSLHPESIYLCMNGQLDCTKSTRLRSVRDFEALLLRSAYYEDRTAFHSSLRFALEVFGDENWKALEQHTKQLRKLAKEYSRLPRKVRN